MPEPWVTRDTPEKPESFENVGLTEAPVNQDLGPEGDHAPLRSKRKTLDVYSAGQVGCAGSQRNCSVSTNCSLSITQWTSAGKMSPTAFQSRGS